MYMSNSRKCCEILVIFHTLIYPSFTPHQSAALTASPRGGSLLICLLADYVAWALFGFHVGFADVFSDDAKGDELDAAKEANSYHDAGPAAKGVTQKVLND